MARQILLSYGPTQVLHELFHRTRLYVLAFRSLDSLFSWHLFLQSELRYCFIWTAVLSIETYFCWIAKISYVDIFALSLLRRLRIIILGVLFIVHCRNLQLCSDLFLRRTVYSQYLCCLCLEIVCINDTNKRIC